MAWYNKYRPQSFEEVVGQQLVKTVLENAVKKQVIKHAYLFSGPKGVGKTTLARIFANQLNGVGTNSQSALDILELDAASNTGVDNIRQLIESASTPPIAGKYKIYIIDEVHMLSKPAMNALLKTLEEPPEYLVFLLATTNPEKLIPTVLSRLTKLPLTAHTQLDLVGRLQFIAQVENLKIDLDSLNLIAKRASGSQRDAINLLETVASCGLENYSIEETAKILGLLPLEIIKNFAENIINQSTIDVQLIEQVENLGLDGQTFLIQTLDFLIDESFAGKTQFDALIIPISEALNLKLPLNSVVSAMVITRRLLLEKNNTTQPQSSSKPSETKTLRESVNFAYKVKSAKPEVISEIQTPLASDTSTKNDDAETQETQPNSSITPQSTTQTAGELSLAELNKWLNFVKIDSATPLTLKMFLNDVNFNLDENNLVKFLVSSRVFVNQLEVPKIKAFLAESLQQFFGQSINYTAEVKVQEKEFMANFQSEPDYPPVELDSMPSFEESASYSPTPSVNNQNPANQPSSGEIFYQVVGNPPAQLLEKGIPVFEGNLNPKDNTNDLQSTTKSQSTTQEQAWNDLVEQSFDLE